MSDFGLRSPLLDSFRRGDVAADVKVLAAQGAIVPRPLEQLGLLVLLCNDADADIRKTAETTIAKIPVNTLSAFIARHDVPLELRDFFVQRGIPVADTPAPDEDEALIDEDDTDYGPEPVTEDDKLSIVQRIAKMSVPEKVRAAMKGSREMRGVLIRDSNKLVALSVLSSPKLTETEVESIARMGSVAEDVLRAIARVRAWIKNYTVVLALAQNAKTPLAISMNLLNRLQEGDIKKLSTNRNIPEALRIAARKRLVLG